MKEKMIPWLAYWLSRLTNGSLRLQVKGRDQVTKLQKSNQQIIFAMWHGHLWLPVYYLADKDYVALASRSDDGEYISRVLAKFGWEVVRGSTSRGGARSLLQLVKKLRAGKNIAITPDGPRGPRHQVKSGVLYLAQKTDSVIIPLGVAFNRKKVFSSWDQFELPYPFTKSALVYGRPIEITEVNQAAQQQLQTGLTTAVAEAEEMLEA
ncbi:lysophospholipid acyltransferase family protein [Halanaerobaculum tunisiense]